MATIDDGGRAFPRTLSASGSDGGMSLRDYFAAAALTALLSKREERPSTAALPSEVPRDRNARI